MLTGSKRGRPPTSRPPVLPPKLQKLASMVIKPKEVEIHRSVDVKGNRRKSPERSTPVVVVDSTPTTSLVDVPVTSPTVILADVPQTLCVIPRLPTQGSEDHTMPDVGAITLQAPASSRKEILEDLKELMWKKEFDTSYVGFMKDGAQWLVDNTDIKLVGIDYLSIAAFDDLIPSHLVLLKKRDIIIVEGLKLENVQPGLYDLHCLPLRLRGAEGSPISKIFWHRGRICEVLCEGDIGRSRDWPRNRRILKRREIADLHLGEESNLSQTEVA
ncbi:hypothetical protein MA16_Dca008216 [Dendrobium catenatum]|uniref:Uncharacterized protein n=1 Tax=Dendrobium catenatum TaxID=906689 RepID=A0A2I0X6I6_9ASPA|nr:hypothetical protein MA16_Dca008216 [Dendrobium catenatum]